MACTHWFSWSDQESQCTKYVLTLKITDQIFPCRNDQGGIFLAWAYIWLISGAYLYTALWTWTLISYMKFIIWWCLLLFLIIVIIYTKCKLLLKFTQLGDYNSLSYYCYYLLLSALVVVITCSRHVGFFFTVSYSSLWEPCQVHCRKSEPLSYTKTSQIMARVFFSQRSWQRLWLGQLCGPLGAAHQSALRASGILAEEGKYARELTKFYVS